MGNKISQTQLISIGFCYLLGTIVVSVFVSAVAKNECWLVGLLGGIFFIPVLLVYRALTRRHPGKGLFEINTAVFGRVGGRLLSAAYLIFLLSLCALNILEASNFLYYFIIPDTPLVAIAALLMLACVYCVRKGFLAVARVSTLFGLFALAGLLFSALLSLNHANFEFLLPVFNLSALDYLQSGHIAAAIPFGESFVLLFLIPELDERADVGRAYLAVTLLTVCVMTLVHLREVTSLGPLIAYTTQPSYEAVRIINIADILSRMESLFALLLISLTFFKTLILFHLCLRGTAELFCLESADRLVLLLAALLTVYAVDAYGSPSSNIFWGKNVSPFIWSLFTFVLPLLTLIASAAGRRLGARRGVESG